jgi:diguanylate cyclase (GGDEF)-like protein/PAS domain S-box-containing protein
MGNAMQPDLPLAREQANTRPRIRDRAIRVADSGADNHESPSPEADGLPVDRSEPPIPHLSGAPSGDGRDGAHAPGPETLFQHLVEHIPGIVAYMDLVQLDNPDSSIPVYISPQVEDLLGYPREAWLTDEELWLDVLHPEDRERMVAADANARATLSTLFAEYRMVARDGRVVWVSEKAAVVEDAATGAVYWQGVMVDITDRKTAEGALATSERQFRSVFDAAAIGVMTIDLEGRILEANQTLEQVCNYPPGALHGQLLGDYLETSDNTSLERLAELAAGHRDRCQLEHLFRRNDRSLMWCRTVMAVVRDDAGQPAHVTAMLEDISDRKLVEADLVHRTLHDGLTELPNRQHFLDRLRQTRARRFSTGSGVAVVFMDLDGFKEVNDSQGHHAGDELLLAVARRLKEAVRPSDTIARFGGDEFVVLAAEVDSAHDATQLAWRLTNALRPTFSVIGTTVTVTASMGVAYSADPEDAAEDIVRKADAAMYLAKQRGRNRVEVFGGADDEALAS